MIPAAELKVRVAINGMPQAKRELLGFDRDLSAVSGRDVTATLHAKVDHAGFNEFAALKQQAQGDATIHLKADVENGGFREFFATMAKIRTATAKPIVQQIKLEYDTSELGDATAMAAAHAGPNGNGGVNINQDVSSLTRAAGGGEKSGEYGIIGPLLWGRNFSSTVNKLLTLRRAGGDSAGAGETHGLLGSLLWGGHETTGVTSNAPEAALGIPTPTPVVRPQANSEIVAQTTADATVKALREMEGATKGAYDKALAEAVLGARGSGGHEMGGHSSGGGSSGSFWGSLFGSHGGGGGGHNLKNFLWGDGKWGLPGFGSVGSFAGFGAEHLLFTAGGLAGSATAAGIGGGLLAGGALGKLAVGGGSDALVMHSTIAGVKTLYAGWEEVAKVQAKYGKGSKQAKEAEREFQHTMQGMGGGKALHAELGVAKEASALKTFWDSSTQDAKVNATKILSQVVGLGHAFVPKVAEAAKQNFALVDQGIKPLFSWLKGPEGMGIWNQFENEFKKNLPDSMQALDQGVQFVIKTMAVASKYTGGFVEELDHFFTKENSPAFFTKWEAEIGRLIGDFHTWSDLIKVLGRDLVDLFSNDAGTGKDIVHELTEMLTKLGQWERSTVGEADLKNIFSVHKEEILELLKVLPPLLEGFGSLYLTIAPPLVKAVTQIAKGFAWVLNELDSLGSGMRDFLGASIVAAKLGLLTTPLKTLGSYLASSALSFLHLEGVAKTLGFDKVVAGNDAVVASNQRVIASNGDLAASYIEADGGMGLGAKSATSAALGLEGDTIGGAEGFGSKFLGRAGMGGGIALAGGLAGNLIGGKAGKVVSFAGYGAGAGMLFGPEGAAVGAAAGAAAGGIIDLLTAEKQLTPLQKKLAKTGEEAAAAFRGQRRAAGELGQAQSNLDGTEKRHKVATEAVKRAHQDLNKTIKQFGPDSRQATEAELRLSTAQHRDALTAHEVQSAHRLAGNSLKLYKHESEEAVRADRERLPPLQSLVKHMREKRMAEPENWPLLRQTVKDENELTKVQNEANKVIEESTKRVNPAFAKSLEAIQPFQKELQKSFANTAKAGNAFHKQLHALATPQLNGLHIDTKTTEMFGQTAHTAGKHVTNSYAEIKGALGPFRTETQAKLQQAEGDVKSWSTATQKGIGEVQTSFQGLAGKLGITGIGFEVSASGKKAKGHQRGGPINVGAPSGDSVPAMLEKGEYVLNRNAVEAVGVQNLHAINFGSAPRFQKGGSLGAEPHLNGPAGALTSLGQGAIHDLYKGAEKYLAKHKPKAKGATGSIAGLNVPNGPIEQMAREMVERVWGKSQWAPFVSVEMQEAGWNPHAQNPTSTAYGLAQNLNPATYPAAGRPGSSAPILDQAKAQLEWMVSYIKGRYGSPAGAWAHEQAFNWYQKGGQVGFQGGGTATASRTHSKNTASDVVAWALNNVGRGPEWGDPPGGWCGEFLGADMKAHGITPPAGYSAADTWGSWGKPLSRNSVQAGAVLDYGSGHVALATSSSQQVQGDAIGNVVGTSSIGGIINGSGLTNIRWPPYKEGPGAGSEIHENVPAMFHGCRTKKLHFPSMPKTIRGVESEIHLRSGELKRYRRVVPIAAHAPSIQHALKVNVSALESRLNQLYTQRHKLRLTKAEHVFVHGKHGLAKQLRGITGFETKIAEAERNYNERNQFASQVVGLEPQAPELPASAGEAEREAAEKVYAGNFASYVEGKERPAFEAVLGAEASWRNTVLGGEGQASSLERNWEAQVRKIDTEIDAINKLSMAKAKTAKAKQKIERMREKLPFLRFKDKELRKVLGEARGEFWPGIGKGNTAISPPLPPLAGSGSFEESLISVQGIHWPEQHSALPVSALAPPRHAGMFGGAIWETQEAIEGLALNIKQASSGIGGSGGGSGSEGPHEAELRELLTQANQRTLVQGALGATLSQFEASYALPYMGAFAEGGVALVGERGRELVNLPSGARVHNAADTERMLNAGNVKVVVNGHINQEPGDTRDPVETFLNDRRVDAHIERKVRQTRAGLPTPGGARR